MAYQVTFSRYVIDNFALGVTVKGVSQSIDGMSTTAFALDFGSVYNVGSAGLDHCGPVQQSRVGHEVL